MKRSAGFTLLEVMVAVAVLGIALAAVIKTTSSSGANLSHLRERTLAHWVAENRLAEMQAMGDFNGDGRGSVEMAGREWFWRVETEDTEIPSLRRVEIRVSASAAAADSLAVLSGFLADPELRAPSTVVAQPPADDSGGDGIEQ